MFLLMIVLISLLLPLPAFSSSKIDSKKDPYAAIPAKEGCFRNFTSCILTMPRTPLDNCRARAHQNWAPTSKLEVLDRCVISANIANDGRMYDIKVSTSSKNIQLDADCLQAVMSVSGSFSPEIPEGTLSKVLFTFDSTTKPGHPDGISRFKARFSSLKADYIAFYRIPFEILNRYPGLFTEAELLADENIGLIEVEKNAEGKLELQDHDLNKIRELYQGIWVPFFLSHKSPTKEQVIAIKNDLRFDERSVLEGISKQKATNISVEQTPLAGDSKAKPRNRARPRRRD